MAGYIVRGDEKGVILKAAEVDAVLHSGNGDAALLYLALQRADRGVTEAQLINELHLNKLRLNAAETALQDMGILRCAATPIMPAEPERVTYSAQDMAQMLSDQQFVVLRQQVVEKLGKKLNQNDDQILANLYHDMGLGADVVYLLVCHCMERSVRSYGEGRRPTLRQIEKEGYHWARLGIMDQTAAARYLKDYQRKLSASAAYMKAMRLGERAPVDSEQKYIISWMDMGFAPESVALAYDRTVLRKQGMDWRYLNGILRRWNENGWHTVSEVEAGENRGRKTQSQSGSTNSWMKQYTKR